MGALADPPSVAHRGGRGDHEPEVRHIVKRLPVQIVLGALVLVAGVLLFIEAARWADVPAVIWTAVLAAGSVTFWYVFFADASSWWAALPGAALAGAAVVQLMELDPDGLGQWTEVPMLAVMGIGFWAIYLRDHQRWWAIIPGGVLLTLSVITAITEVASGSVIGAVFLTGAAVTFALVAVLPGGQTRRWWALIPAGVLAVGALVVLAGAAEWFLVLNLAWPLAIIAAGTFLLWRALRPNR
jgi:hypothetical protein